MENYLSWVCTDQILGPRCVVKAARIWQGEAGLYLVTPTASL